MNPERRALKLDGMSGLAVATLSITINIVSTGRLGIIIGWAVARKIRVKKTLAQIPAERPGMTSAVAALDLSNCIGSDGFEPLSDLVTDNKRHLQ